VSDIAGTWVVSSASRRYLPSSGQGPPPTIVLEPNGHFKAIGLPGEVLFEPGHGPEFVNGEGTWSLGVLRPSANQHIQLSFSSIENVTDGSSYGTQLYVSGGRGTPVIFFFHGDPDQGMRVSFARPTR
jgi:hypothetical protein